MEKNVVEKARTATIDKNYDCGVLEVQQLVNEYRNDMFELSYTSFKYGYLQGMKAAAAKIKD